MDDETVRQTLLIEAHRVIAEAAAHAVAVLRDPSPAISYPPGARLGPGDVAAIASLGLDPAQAAAVEKVVADAFAAAFATWLGLLDGTSDPEVEPPEEPWLGASLGAPVDRADDELLCDAFFEAWHAWNER